MYEELYKVLGLPTEHCRIGSLSWSVHDRDKYHQRPNAGERWKIAGVVGRMWFCGQQSISETGLWVMGWSRNHGGLDGIGIWKKALVLAVVMTLAFRSGGGGVFLEIMRNPTGIFFPLVATPNKFKDSGLRPGPRLPAPVPLLGGFLIRPSWSCYPPCHQANLVSTFTMHLLIQSTGIFLRFTKARYCVGP